MNPLRFYVIFFVAFIIILRITIELFAIWIEIQGIYLNSGFEVLCVLALISAVIAAGVATIIDLIFFNKSKQKGKLHD